MKKNRKKNLRNAGKQAFLSEKRKSRAIIRALLADEQTLICCVIETGDGAPNLFRTTRRDCEQLARDVGVEARILPVEKCRQLPN